MTTNSKTPKTKRGQATRQKILQAAQQEIGQKGFSEASVSSITTAAGIGQGTFYIYFDSKEEVLQDLVLDMGKAVRHHLTEATAQAETRMEVERLGLEAFIQFVRANHDLYKIVHEAQFIDPAVHKQYYSDFAQAYCKRLEEASQADEISTGNTEACAWALMGMGEFLGLRYGLWDDKTDINQVVDAAFHMIEHGLRR